ncbi:hypothetical protein CF319_g3766 [Tilletia indica]|nr:hypothetical protein CF319_g3766 [Tilletia indica]
MSEALPFRLSPSRRTTEKISNFQYIPPWLLSHDACQTVADIDTGFKKPLVQAPNGSLIEVEETASKGYVAEGDLDWGTWLHCTQTFLHIMIEENISSEFVNMDRDVHG